MSNHLGDTNKMVSDTPRTDAEYDNALEFEFDSEDRLQEMHRFSKKLERELNAANDRIKRLEEAGDRMRLFCADNDDCFAWDRARKGNP